MRTRTFSLGLNACFNKMRPRPSIPGADRLDLLEFTFLERDGFLNNRLRVVFSFCSCFVQGNNYSQKCFKPFLKEESHLLSG